LLSEVGGGVEKRVADRLKIPLKTESPLESELEEL
jgi:hypothetical protein